MNKVFLSLGSNQGDRLELLSQARELINNRVGDIMKTSSIYETEPWGFETDQPFLNQVIQVQTEQNAYMILDEIFNIERLLGRVRGEVAGYTSRTMDIDILFINDIIIESDQLNIPHKHLPERRFILEPLCDIEPHFVHPILNKRIDELLSECIDEKKVSKWTD